MGIDICNLIFLSLFFVERSLMSQQFIYIFRVIKFNIQFFYLLTAQQQLLLFYYEVVQKTLN